MLLDVESLSPRFRCQSEVEMVTRESRPLNRRIVPGLVLSGLAAGIAVGSTGMPGAAAAAGTETTARAPGATRSADWRSRLVVQRDSTSSAGKRYASVACNRWAPWGSVQYLFILQANHTADYAKGRAGGTCSAQVAAISTEASAAKNGTYIPELDSIALDDNTAAVYSPLAVYHCGNCTGSWISKHTIDYKKYGGQTMSIPDPPMDCNPLRDGNNQVVGWSCFLSGSYYVT